MPRMRPSLVAVPALLACSAIAFAAGPARQTELASSGPLAGGADSMDLGFGFPELSASGTHAFFTTDEPLVPEDTDTDRDIYQHTGGVTSLVSTGPLAGGVGTADATLSEVSADGSAVFFTTAEPLTDEDTDSDTDGYRRKAGTTTLVTTGAAEGGPDSGTALIRGIAAGGDVVFFTTSEPIESGDPDTTGDVYRRDLTGAPATALVSTGPLDGGAGTADASFGGSTEDALTVFFATTEPMVAAGDNDTHFDLYRRQSATTALVSHGPQGGGADSVGISFFIGAGVGPDANMLFFGTEPLSPGDTDTHADVYRTSSAAGGEPLLVSEGPREGGADSADASAATTGAGARLHPHDRAADVRRERRAHRHLRALRGDDDAAHHEPERRRGRLGGHRR